MQAGVVACPDSGYTMVTLGVLVPLLSIWFAAAAPPNMIQTNA
jgi:hypothetical protein